jgi:hypothetical protein
MAQTPGGLEIIDTEKRYEEKLVYVHGHPNIEEVDVYFSEGWKVKHMIPYTEGALICIWREQ